MDISWDVALEPAAATLLECYDTDIRKLVQMYSFAPYESGHATLGIGLWAMALGTPNSSSTKGQMCAIHYGGCYTLSAFPTVNYDAVYCDYLVILGKSVGYDSGLAGGDARSFADGLRRGLKFVTVGPRASMEATRGQAGQRPLARVLVDALHALQDRERLRRAVREEQDQLALPDRRQRRLCPWRRRQALDLGCIVRFRQVS